jgi:methylenetetrahydrofolate--tRNA-(uracil-5-)-methyltransferase
MIDFTRYTALGSLANYISTYNTNFQPMNVNHGIFEQISERIKKQERKEYYAKRSLNFLDKLLGDINDGN